MKIRNKRTGQVFEVVAGTLYADNIFEEVLVDNIKVGEPKIEYEITEELEVEPEEPKKVNKKKTNVKKTAKRVNKTKKGAKKNETSTK